MQKNIDWLWIAGCFGLTAVAHAQTPPSFTAGTKFDGTYAFVSATNVNETYTTMITNHILRCPDRRAARPLVIVNSRARLLLYEGTVGSKGELEMRNTPQPTKFGTLPGSEVTINGSIDADGTVRARQIGYNCSYDLIWQKMPK